MCVLLFESYICNSLLLAAEVGSGAFSDYPTVLAWYGLIVVALVTMTGC